MGLCRSPLALLCVMWLAHICCAQNSQQDYLNAHNTARAQVGVGPMSWDNTVATYAQNYANKRIGDCNLVHSGGPYGENLAWGSGTPLTGTAAVNMWVGEKPYYNYDSNSCRNSVRLGCARVQCNNGGWFVTSLAHICCAQNSPQDYLNAHNTARAQVGVGPMSWDNTLAAYAQNYNLAWGSPSLTGTDAVNMWVGEKSNYDHNSNSCVGGQCGHYTQVVWSKSVRLGCARVQCNKGGWFVTCNYDPRGNYIGQRPY
ncbi:hypothetical protein PVL29_003437 [Vitis rotundifolia]|uniref:SCP domain-containing protein n=1 Tax=Vitis rotundifolia TaxID=103349 RepID=A0AA39E3M1_VITRO|nr:hypothetical protein PVL29_003437 [Vitis rotundifolia]